MSLHSSYKDFRDYQISNVYFDSLKKTPPSRLHYFFCPELDYNGYINVVRDQEEQQFKKHVHAQNLSMNRQEMRRKHCKRMISREMLEKQLGMPHARANSKLDEFANSMGLTNGEELHKSVRENMRRSKSEASGEGVPMKLPAHERWRVSRKNMLDKRAISMIENRMQQEANELQLMEGWRAAARNSIRDKFVETRHRNNVVEHHMDFLHTREKLSPSPNSTQQLNSTQMLPGAGETGDSREWMQPASPLPHNDAMPESPSYELDRGNVQLEHGNAQLDRAPSAMSLPDNLLREQQASPFSHTSSQRSRSTLPHLPGSATTPLPDIKMSPGEVAENQYVLDSLDQIDEFSTAIEDRQVKSNQRLRSLAIDSTKSWTRPMPR